MIDTHRIHAIAFDFDGVILDSVALKTQLFIDAYDEPLAPQQKEAIRAYQARHGGVGRVKKFEYFEKSAFRHEPDPVAVKALASRYSDMLMERSKPVRNYPARGHSWNARQV
jgi:phosphoglycolate phosphatase